MSKTSLKVVRGALVGALVLFLLPAVRLFDAGYCRARVAAAGRLVGAEAP